VTCIWRCRVCNLSTTSSTITTTDCHGLIAKRVASITKHSYESSSRQPLVTVATTRYEKSRINRGDSSTNILHTTQIDITSSCDRPCLQQRALLLSYSTLICRGLVWIKIPTLSSSTQVELRTAKASFCPTISLSTVANLLALVHQYHTRVRSQRVERPSIRRSDTSPLPPPPPLLEAPHKIHHPNLDISANPAQSLQGPCSPQVSLV